MKTFGKDTEIREVVIGEGPVFLAGIVAVARRGVPVRPSGSADFRERMERSRGLMYAAIEADVPVYGVTTGYGKSCGNRLRKSSVLNEGANLMRFHGCGTGAPLGTEETRAAMLCRMLCLARGYSGVSIPLLEHLAAFLNAGITPVVPCEGSVGASRVCTLAERVEAIHMLAAAQACEIRGRMEARPRLDSMLAELRRLAAPTFEDRHMDADIEAVAREISENGFPKENGWKRRNAGVTK